MYLLKFIVLLAIPGALFAAALYLHLQVVLGASWPPMLELLPLLAVGVGLFLAWRFSRTRVLWAIFVLTLVERALALATPFAREYVLQIAALLVPVNLVLFSWWSERGLFTRHGLLRLVILVLQLGGVAWLYLHWAGEVVAWLSRPLSSWPWLESLPFTHTGMLVMVACMIALLVRFARKPQALEGSFCWVLGAVAAGFWWPNHFPFWAGVAVFLLAFAIIESNFRVAFNDELTGLPGRRAMHELLLKVGRRYTLAMIDVDHFKKINDKHGRDVGDQVLRMVATCLRRVSGGGRAYHYGGEEFVVIFPNKELERALPHLEELCATIARARFVVRGRKRPRQRPEAAYQESSGRGKLQVTVSIGAASRDERYAAPQQLIKAAGQALHTAKRAGRNQVRTV